MKNNFFNEIQYRIFQWNSNIIHFYKASLHLAIEKGNIEIVKLLLTSDKLDINLLLIFNMLCFYKIQNHIFQLYLKSYLSITFNIIFLNFIFYYFFPIKFKIISLYEISKNNFSSRLYLRYIFQLDSKSCLSMKFKIISVNSIQSYTFKYNWKMHFLMKFKIASFNEILIL